MTAMVQGMPLNEKDHLTILAWELLEYASLLEPLLLQQAMLRPPPPLVMSTSDWDAINGRATRAYQG